MGDWLPPQAPGGRPPPRFEMVAPEAPAPAPDALHQPVVAPPRPPAPPPAAAATHGLALTALILGILGIALTVVTFGLGCVLGVPCAVVACRCGARARARIAHGQAGGKRGQANAGYVLGVAGVVIGVAAAIGWIVWVASGGDFDTLQQDLERWQDEHTRDAAVQAVLAVLGR
jgi:hypothetical protein